VSEGDYGPSTYGDRIADVFDQSFVPDDARDVVRFLAPLAGRGPALELGIGTGRVALPLKRRGVDMHGIDASEAMVARLREKRGGADVPVTVDDFAAVRVEGRYPLIFVVFNTFFALLTQEEQIRCFRNVGRRLTADGVFVIEAFVPDMKRFDRDQRTETFDLTTETVRLDVAVHDSVEQRVTSHHVLISERGIKLYPVQLRYAWPSEMDLMARLAGMRLRDRFGGWHEEPFTAESDRHVSVYELGPSRRRTA
jgi:SAM-dependent methyltransferase